MKKIFLSIVLAAITVLGFNTTYWLDSNDVINGEQVKWADGVTNTVLLFHGEHAVYTNISELLSGSFISNYVSKLSPDFAGVAVSNLNMGDNSLLNVSNLYARSIIIGKNNLILWTADDPNEGSTLLGKNYGSRVLTNTIREAIAPIIYGYVQSGGMQYNLGYGNLMGGDIKDKSQVCDGNGNLLSGCLTSGGQTNFGDGCVLFGTGDEYVEYNTKGSMAIGRHIRISNDYTCVFGDSLASHIPNSVTVNKLWLESDPDMPRLAVPLCMLTNMLNNEITNVYNDIDQKFVHIDGDTMLGSINFNWHDINNVSNINSIGNIDNIDSIDSIVSIADISNIDNITSIGNIHSISSDVSFLMHTLKDIASPTSPHDVANKLYVDAATNTCAELYVEKAGDTMHGDLTITNAKLVINSKNIYDSNFIVFNKTRPSGVISPWLYIGQQEWNVTNSYILSNTDLLLSGTEVLLDADIVSTNAIVDKAYVDNKVDSIDLSLYVEKDGDTMTGDLVMHNARITTHYNTGASEKLILCTEDALQSGDIEIKTGNSFYDKAGDIIIKAGNVPSTTPNEAGAIKLQAGGAPDYYGGLLGVTPGKMFYPGDVVIARSTMNTPTSVVTKAYVDNKVDSIDFSPYVKKVGDTMSGDLNFINNAKITASSAYLTLSNNLGGIELQAGANTIPNLGTSGGSVHIKSGSGTLSDGGITIETPGIPSGPGDSIRIQTGDSLNSGNIIIKTGNGSNHKGTVQISDVATPTSSNDAANKAYVDQIMVPVGSIIMYTDPGPNYQVEQNTDMHPTVAQNSTMFYNATSNPNGRWLLCSQGYAGTYTINGKIITVPNLEGRFIVGAGNDPSTTAGYTAASINDSNGDSGESKHRLTKDELPDVKLKVEDLRKEVSESSSYTQRVKMTAGFAYTELYETEKLGSGAYHENRPPFYVVYYIIRVQ